MQSSATDPSTADYGRLDDRVALVTGATGGIGRAIAVEFAAAGADVIIHGNNKREAADEVAQHVRSLGRQAHVILADLAEQEHLARLLDEAWNWRSGVDIWVNNAGVDVLTGEAARWPFERKLEQLWRVDVQATVYLSRAVGERMRRRSTQPGSGVLINMGWDQAEQGMGGDSGEMFSAAKGAVMAFTRSLAQSLAPQVRVNCLAPGWIKTSWGSATDDYWQKRAEKEALLARWGRPEDVAHAARWLASSSASFISGQIVRVNGGFNYSE